MSRTPLHLTNRLCAQPAARAVTLASAGASGAPPERRARLWKAPAAMAVRAALDASGVGLGRKASVVPTPSWPSLLRPHARGVSSERMARLWSQPAAIALTVAPPRDTATGVLLQAKVAQVSE